MLQQRAAALVGHRQPIDLLGERPPATALAVTEQPPHQQADQHRAAPDSNIGQRPAIATVHPRRLVTTVRTRHPQLAGTSRHMHGAPFRPHPLHPHRVQMRRRHPYEVITLADSPATRDGASPAHGGIHRLHGDLARTTFRCTPTTTRNADFTVR